MPGLCRTPRLRSFDHYRRLTDLRAIASGRNAPGQRGTSHAPPRAGAMLAKNSAVGLEDRYWKNQRRTGNVMLAKDSAVGLEPSHRFNDTSPPYFVHAVRDTHVRQRHVHDPQSHPHNRSPNTRKRSTGCHPVFNIAAPWTNQAWAHRAGSHWPSCWSAYARSDADAGSILRSTHPR